MSHAAATAIPMSAPVAIRPARPGDFDAIRRVHGITFKEHAAREPSFNLDTPFIEGFLSSFRRPFSALRAPFAKERVFVLVAEVDGAVVGHLAYVRHSNKIGPYAAVIADLSIDPAMRRSGLGRKLVQAMERREARDGVTSFAAGIWPENRASHQLFQSLGYAPFEGSNPGDDPQTLVHKSVEFSALPLAVLMVKSAALTLLVIATLYLLRMTFFT